MKKSNTLLMLAALVVLSLTVTTSAYGGQKKVAVCHVTGTHDFGSGEVPIGHVISIAEPAYRAHRSHGDPPAWEMVTLPDGAEVCTTVTSPKIVFVTNDSSGQVVGRTLGGLSGADAICQNLAQNAGLTGTYKAWLSAAGAGNSAAERLTHSTGPYQLRNGTIVANNWADLVDGSLQAPIILDENGNCGASEYRVDQCPVYGEVSVWTSTNPDGSYNGDAGDCNAWNIEDPFSNITGGWGFSTSTDSAWTVSVNYNCDGSAQLYCFQQ